MPQWRKLHVKAIESLDINDMPDDFTRLLWVMLPLGLDREGRGLDNPAWVKAKIMPLRMDVTTEMVSGAMDWYAGRGMIERYEVDGRRYFWLPTFSRYQGSTDREAESNFPPPPSTVPTSSQPAQELVETSSSTDSESESEGEPPPRDYLDDLLAAGNGSGVADPAQDKQARYQYRDKALKVYHDLTDLFPDRKVGRPAIVKLAREPGFDLDRWQRSIESCRLNGVNPHNIACIIDTYRAGGDYRAMLDGRKAGNGAHPGQRAGPVVVVNESGQRTMVVK